MTLRWERGTANGQLEAPPPGRGKPVPGCYHGLPLPTAKWALELVERWTREADGSWRDAKGRTATLQCAPVKVKAVENAAWLVPNPRSDGCAGENQLILSGGPRMDTPAMRCRLKTRDELLTLTFGVERVMSTNDCGGGADWRVVRP